ncbi:hypothetical protein E2C01_101236 [Portunus trituberculatus]|uniref:Uncharacterized protein n=1 Tax=Portunus trituberculatus TaxID=210409 RepID=A0A5B7KE90_PORTR|nr:hypothetical protein [Portunus trituberculatus]
MEEPRTSTIFLLLFPRLPHLITHALLAAYTCALPSLPGC